MSDFPPRWPSWFFHLKNYNLRIATTNDLMTHLERHFFTRNNSRSKNKAEKWNEGNRASPWNFSCLFLLVSLARSLTYSPRSDDVLFIKLLSRWDADEVNKKTFSCSASPISLEGHDQRFCLWRIFCFWVKAEAKKSVERVGLDLEISKRRKFCLSFQRV